MEQLVLREQGNVRYFGTVLLSVSPLLYGDISPILGSCPWFGTCEVGPPVLSERFPSRTLIILSLPLFESLTPKLLVTRDCSILIIREILSRLLVPFHIVSPRERVDCKPRSKITFLSYSKSYRSNISPEEKDDVKDSSDSLSGVIFQLKGR